MKPIVFPALVLALGMLTACESRMETSSTTVTDSATTASERIETIAGDKTLTADLLRRSYQKGTLDDALALAMQDSSLAAEVLVALRNDPRFAGMLADPSAATAKTLASTRSTTPSRSSRSTATATSRDPLTQTENAMKKTNEKLDQAERVRQQMEEARRKAEGILKPR